MRISEADANHPPPPHTHTVKHAFCQVPFLGAIVNKIPQRDHAILSSQLRRRFSEGGIPLLGAIPDVRCRATTYLTCNYAALL